MAYTDIIKKLDPDVDAEGVEAHMRIRYGALDHLNTATFVYEIGMAKECEQMEPGYLAVCRESMRTGRRRRQPNREQN